MKRKGLMGLVATLLSSAGLALAQEPLAKMPSAGTPISTVHAAPADYVSHDAAKDKGPTWWFNAEHLLWRTKNQPLSVPVLSTADLSTPGAEILIGGGTPLNPHLRQGGRFSAGTYLGCEKQYGIEGSYFFLGERGDSRTASSPGGLGAQTQGIPFAAIDGAGNSGEAFVALAGPGIANTTTLDMRTFLQGYEVNGLYNLLNNCNLRVDLIAGGRYLDLNESLTLSTSSPTLPGLALNNFEILDRFETRNQFYGGQVGAKFEWNSCRFFVNGSAKVAAGRMQQEVNVNGAFRQTTAAGVAQTPGGVFSQPSNLGRVTRDEFAYVPEGTLNVGYKVNENIRVFGGYSFLWVSNVLRPGDQIDRVINVSQTPAGLGVGGTGTLVGPARPTVPFNDSSFWAQGVSLGLEIRY